MQSVKLFPKVIGIFKNPNTSYHKKIVKKSLNFNFINALPNKKSEDEEKLFITHDITHICAKNSGGTASIAKLHAARSLGLPVWLLSRPEAELHDNEQNHIPDQFITGDPAEILQHIRDML